MKRVIKHVLGVWFALLGIQLRKIRRWAERVGETLLEETSISLENKLEYKGFVALQISDDFHLENLLFSIAEDCEFFGPVGEWVQSAMEMKDCDPSQLSATYFDLIEPMSDGEIAAVSPDSDYRWGFIDGLIFFFLLVQDQLAGRGSHLLTNGRANLMVIDIPFVGLRMLGVRCGNVVKLNDKKKTTRIKWKWNGWEYDVEISSRALLAGNRVFFRTG